MKKVLIMICILLFTGCGTKEKETITYQELKKLKNYILVDVRTKQEYDISHIPNAELIPLNTINEHIQLDKNKTIVVYCQSGNRSKQAKEKLKSLGYTVYDFGGISNWKGEF